MKKLDVTPITNSAQFFPKKGTLEFLQLAYREGFSAIVQALIGPAYDPTIIYIMYGCVNSGVYPAYNITEGVVFYAGEIYYVDAAAFTSTPPDVAVFTIIQSQYTSFADPVTFSDATTHNIHNILKMLISSAAPASGIQDYVAATVLNFDRVPPTAITASTAGSHADNTTQVSGAFPNFDIYTPPTIPANVPVLLWLGEITNNGATISRRAGTATVSSVIRTGVGLYTINHNIGNTNYFVLGIGIGTADMYSPRAYNSRANTSFNLRTSDDNSGNDSNYELAIYGFTP